MNRSRKSNPSGRNFQNTYDDLNDRVDLEDQDDQQGRPKMRTPTRDPRGRRGSSGEIFT